MSTPSQSPYSCRLNTGLDSIALSPEPTSRLLRPAYCGLDRDFRRLASDLIRYLSPRLPGELPDGLISFAGKPVTWERPRKSNYRWQVTVWLYPQENDGIRVFLGPKKPYRPDFRITTSAKLFRSHPDMVRWLSLIVVDPDSLILRRLDTPVDIQANKLDLQRHLHTPRFSIPIGLRVEQEAGKYDNTFYLGSSRQRYVAVYTKAYGAGGQEIVRIEPRFFGRKLDALGVSRLGDLPWMLRSLDPFEQVSWLPKTHFADVERARRRRPSGQDAYRRLQAHHAGAYSRMREQVAQASKEFRDRITPQWRADVWRFLCPAEEAAVHIEDDRQSDGREPVRETIQTWSATESDGSGRGNDQLSRGSGSLRTEEMYEPAEAACDPDALAAPHSATHSPDEARISDMPSPERMMPFPIPVLGSVAAAGLRASLGLMMGAVLCVPSASGAQLLRKLTVPAVVELGTGVLAARPTRQGGAPAELTAGPPACPPLGSMSAESSSQKAENQLLIPHSQEFFARCKAVKSGTAIRPACAGENGPASHRPGTRNAVEISAAIILCLALQTLPAHHINAVARAVSGVEEHPIRAPTGYPQSTASQAMTT